MLRHLSVGVLALCLSRCAELIDLPDSVELVEAGPWSCLDSLAQATAPSETSASVRVQACDFINNCATTVTGLQARVCAKRDVGCTNPIASGLTEQDGLFDFEVPTGESGFDGYLEVSSGVDLCTNTEVFGSAGPMLCGLSPSCNPETPDENCQVPTYARALLFFNPPIVGDAIAPLPLPLLSTAGLPAVIEAAGASMDPASGNLFITAIDCDGAPAAGVTYSIGQHQEEVTQLYVDSGVVSDTILETDSSGIGGFVGVPPGFAEVTGYNSDFERVGEIGVQSAPFTMTYSALVPSP